MKDNLFSGVCTALVTPFRENRIDFDVLEALIDRQIDAGVQALVICGTTGEAPTLSQEEKLSMFRHAVRFTGGRCKIIAGTGTNDTVKTAELTKKAEQCGVDGVLAVSPYYNKATPEGLYLHYKTICASTSLPVIAYNVPSRTGVDIPNSVYCRLWKIKNFAGVKECAGVGKTARLSSLCPAIPVWSGNDDQTVPMLSIGGKGVISVLSNVCPAETVRMVRLALNGDFVSAGKMQCALMEKIDFLFSEVNPIPVKAVLNELGFPVGACRLPLTALSTEKRNRIRKLFG